MLKYLFLFLSILILPQCNMNQSLNELNTSTSLYLRQHKDNPVHWKLWSKETLNRAEEEQKLMIISIGYSSCHWCHVMEEESFEKESVAQIMNNDYISIKIDREERPDLDARYMSAVQLMTGSGGWPLNVIALPDGTPVFGGTYFNQEDWMRALGQIAQMWQDQPERVRDYGKEMRSGLNEMIEVSLTTKNGGFKPEDFQDVVTFWKRTIDPVNGGPNGAPKFPLPSNYSFLLDYALLEKDIGMTDYVFNTLNHMALGGIFDQLHGGFTRYSTDRFWKVPHFEKMLYDNAQLISLYSRAHRASPITLYAETVHKSIKFLHNEMLLKEGLYAAALDADSRTPRENREEGGYYTWTDQEIQALVIPEKELFKLYFDLIPSHDWEGKFILHRTLLDEDFILQHPEINEDFIDLKKGWHDALLAASKSRAKTHPKPIRDEKAITSWNALLVEGFANAHFAFPEKGYNTFALALIDAMSSLLIEKGELAHQYSIGTAQGEAFLDDYAAYGQALLYGYQLTGQDQFLQDALAIAHTIVKKFPNQGNSPFRAYASNNVADWQQVIEIEDNVIPSANSMCAFFFFRIGQFSEQTEFTTTATEMLEAVHGKVFKYGPNFSNWLSLGMEHSYGTNEIVVCGAESNIYSATMTKSTYVPGTVYLQSAIDGDGPLLRGRFSAGTTLIYVCKNSSCQLPTNSTTQAIDIWKN